MKKQQTAATSRVVCHIRGTLVASCLVKSVVNAKSKLPQHQCPVCVCVCVTHVSNKQKRVWEGGPTNVLTVSESWAR